MPDVMNWESWLPDLSSTPSAEYRAPVNALAASTRRRSTSSSSSPLATATPASSSACHLSVPAIAGSSTLRV